jgi:hypothetical protein
MFRSLLAHSQEALHKRHLVYCVRVMSVGCTSASHWFHYTEKGNLSVNVQSTEWRICFMWDVKLCVWGSNVATWLQNLVPSFLKLWDGRLSFHPEDCCHMGFGAVWLNGNLPPPGSLILKISGETDVTVSTGTSVNFAKPRRCYVQEDKILHRRHT